MAFKTLWRQILTTARTALNATWMKNVFISNIRHAPPHLRHIQGHRRIFINTFTSKFTHEEQNHQWNQFISRNNQTLHIMCTYNYHTLRNGWAVQRSVHADSDYLMVWLSTRLLRQLVVLSWWQCNHNITKRQPSLYCR